MTEIPKYGICHLSVIPLRFEASDKSEIRSQLLFGDSFSFIKKSEDERWYYIKNDYEGYEGWIDFKQFKVISKDYHDALKKSKPFLSADLICNITSENKTFPIFFGSALPFYINGTVKIGDENFKYEGQVISPVVKNDFEFLRDIAFKYLNAPYLWGGKGIFGIDCSGFVQQVFRFCGYKLPRDAYQQAECGVNVTGELKPGDLAFFNNDKGRIDHVGIIIENNQIIHASGQVRVDILDKTGIYNGDRKVHSHRIHSIKRIFS